MEMIRRGDNKHNRLFLGYSQLESAEDLGVSVTTVQRFEAKDRADLGRMCETHAFSSKTERIDYPAAKGGTTIETIFTKRCYLCGYEPPSRKRFIYVSEAVPSPS